MPLLLEKYNPENMCKASVSDLSGFSLDLNSHALVSSYSVKQSRFFDYFPLGLYILWIPY